jgi:hypothetical protein
MFYLVHTQNQFCSFTAPADSAITAAIKMKPLEGSSSSSQLLLCMYFSSQNRIAFLLKKTNYLSNKV